MERTIQNNEKTGVFLILISALGYGLMPIFSTYAYKFGTEVSTLMFIRFFISSILLWMYIFIRKLDYKVNKNHLLYIIIISILGYFVASISIYYAYKIISVSIATLILFSHPVFVVIIEKIYYKLPFSMRKSAAMMLTVIGLYTVLYTRDMNINIKGITYSFISSISYAMYCVSLSEKRTQKLSGIVITAYVTLIATITSLLQCFLFGQPLFPSSSVAILSGMSLAVFSTIIASITFYEGLSIIGASSATLISTFEPVFVVILTAVFLHEVLRLNVVVGGLIILFAILLLQKK